MLTINVTSVYVDDQAKALAFYTDVLGFVKKTDVPAGGDARWLTVVSPAHPDGAVSDGDEQHQGHADGDPHRAPGVPG